MIPAPLETMRAPGRKKWLAVPARRKIRGGSRGGCGRYGDPDHRAVRRERKEQVAVRTVSDRDRNIEFELSEFLLRALVKNHLKRRRARWRRKRTPSRNGHSLASGRWIHSGQKGEGYYSSGGEGARFEPTDVARPRRPRTVRLADVARIYIAGTRVQWNSQRHEPDSQTSALYCTVEWRPLSHMSCKYQIAEDVSHLSFFSSLLAVSLAPTEYM